MNQKPLCILLIEDNPDDVVFFRRGAEKAGVDKSVQVAGDGEEAVAYLDGRGSFQDRTLYPLPTFIVLDLKLPQKWGLDVLAWLRKDPRFKDLPVTVLTSSKIINDRRLALDLGSVGFHDKPMDPKELAAMIKTWISVFWK